MSAFMSVQRPGEICMLTDGAAYTKEGIIVRLARKVTIGKCYPIAITTRGNANVGEKHQQRFCDAADRYGFDFALGCFADALPEMGSTPDYDGFDFLHWHIIGYSETEGLVRYSAHNMPFAFSDGEEPMKLHKVPADKNYIAMNNASPATLAECGVLPMAADERLSTYMERMGGNLMEAQRRTPAPALPNDEYFEPQYLIGGQCDLTIVTEDGVDVKTLRTWPDKVGEKIEPYSLTGNVIRLPRQQRRALEREQRKLEKRTGRMPSCA